MITAVLPAVYRLTERAGDDGALYCDYSNGAGQTLTVKATGPAGVIPEPDTAEAAARVFARSTVTEAS